MAPRITVLETGEYYHIYNRSIQKIPIFKGQRECDLFEEAIAFYLQPAPPTKFSLYRKNRSRYPMNLDNKLVTIVNYCLMPNHFHFTLRQEQEDGIRKLMQKLTNSFAHYFNIKYKNTGPVFETNFKATLIENDEQLLHLSRYIHLNPVTSYLVENPEDYPYSSYGIYFALKESKIIDPTIVLSQFKKIEDYKKFVMARKDYQRDLSKIRHLILE